MASRDRVAPRTTIAARAALFFDNFTRSQNRFTTYATVLCHRRPLLRYSRLAEERSAARPERGVEGQSAMPAPGRYRVPAGAPENRLPSAASSRRKSASSRCLGLTLPGTHAAGHLLTHAHACRTTGAAKFTDLRRRVFKPRALWRTEANGSKRSTWATAVRASTSAGPPFRPGPDRQLGGIDCESTVRR